MIPCSPFVLAITDIDNNHCGISITSFFLFFFSVHKFFNLLFILYLLVNKLCNISRSKCCSGALLTGGRNGPKNTGALNLWRSHVAVVECHSAEILWNIFNRILTSTSFWHHWYICTELGLYLIHFPTFYKIAIYWLTFISCTKFCS